jgi:hypothetical protein
VAARQPQARVDELGTPFKPVAAKSLWMCGWTSPAIVKDLTILAVHEALERLAAQDPRKAQFIEMRFFAGMTIDEIAESSGVPKPTVYREVRVAQAWLFREAGPRDRCSKSISGRVTFASHQFRRPLRYIPGYIPGGSLRSVRRHSARTSHAILRGSATTRFIRT